MSSPSLVVRWRRGLRRLRVIRHSPRSPLASRLLRTIFSIYFAVALVVTVVELAMQYREELGKLQHEIDGAVALVLPALSKAVWSFDEKGAQAVMIGLSRSPALSGLRLEGDIPMVLGRVPEAGKGETEGRADWSHKLYEQRYQLFSDQPGEGAIGSLQVFSSSQTVISRAMSVFYAIVASAAVKTVALWLILYFTVLILVARPIDRLTWGLFRIHSEHGGSPRYAGEPGAGDELSFMFKAFVRMRRALRRSAQRLLAHQRDLERTIDERTQALRFQAMHDELTGLMNRRAFEVAMADLMKPGRRPDVDGVLCIIDLDHFKLVNDTFGHAAGDQVLRQVADMLRRNVRSTDIAARIGGDEFAVILVDCSAAEAQAKLDLLRVQVSGLAFEKGGQRVSVGLSAGLVPFGPSSPDVTAIVSQADAACYEAKASGRQQIRLFADPAWQRRRSDLNCASTLEAALSEDRLVLHAQPIVDALTGAVRQLEILVRIELNGQLHLPGSFIDVAERHQMAARIDRSVLAAALKLLAARPRLLSELESVAINLSAASVCDPSFYRFAVGAARRAGVPMHKLCFEITEGTPIADMDRAVRIMNGLRRRGAGLALDDFGRGMASYAYLQQLPVDVVKIDGSFVTGIAEDPVSASIVSSVNHIAHLAGKTTVAEFVESEDIARRLREMRVDRLQGYYCGRPAPLETFAQAAEAAHAARATAEAAGAAGPAERGGRQVSSEEYT
ncbi:MAG TPA: EAL domain-containing protein [Burkholderiaceae bacterium]|nr:EAL domain-containing protein [Burkholderiaceae bacterium]